MTNTSLASQFYQIFDRYRQRASRRVADVRVYMPPVQMRFALSSSAWAVVDPAPPSTSWNQRERETGRRGRRLRQAGRLPRSVP